MVTERLVDLIEQHLAGMKTELWPGVAYYLTDPISREAAARWLAETMEGFANSNDGLSYLSPA